MIRRIPTSDLFHIGPTGLEEISDDTLNARLDALEHAALLQSSAGYKAAVAEEMLQIPEAV